MADRAGVSLCSAFVTNPRFSRLLAALCAKYGFHCVPEDRGLVVFEKQINELVNCLRILSLTYSMAGLFDDPDSPLLDKQLSKRTFTGLS